MITIQNKEGYTSEGDEMWDAIANTNVNDRHRKICGICGLRTDFLFDDGCCEFCTTHKGEA